MLRHRQKHMQFLKYVYRIRKHTHLHTQLHIIQTHYLTAGTHTHIYTLTHTHSNIHTDTLTNTHTNTHTHSHTYTCTHTHTRARALTSSLTNRHTDRQ